MAILSCGPVIITAARKRLKSSHHAPRDERHHAERDGYHLREGATHGERRAAVIWGIAGPDHFVVCLHPGWAARRVTAFGKRVSLSPDACAGTVASPAARPR